ncbi:hypothetical protein [Pseudomarimonas arenosa]|uniref:Uncharacterized protein n=1 Tax=Pseudomarimonas arenosa TaxID=2774145 RepID=A0AAW3ZUS0_9GAMM|nr:hypothetical protein [Pseudomarimonas arenosa]MBD8528179.1 hypothetical protein [Pseudomarimonas arenosa]
MAVDLLSGRAQDSFTIGDAALQGELDGRVVRLSLAEGDVIAHWIDPSDDALRAARFAPLRPFSGPAAMADGVWHATDTVGQGFLFETFDGGERLGGAWFTYDAGADEGDSGLRWYTVQADYEGADSGFVGTLYESARGAFARSAAETTAAVGNVELRLESCDRAVLNYQFHSGDSVGLSRSIPLVRTAAEANVCASIALERHEFSGVFYNPDTVGQGFLLRTVDGAGSQKLAGGWFTFDPEGASNDAASHHWFTVQADIPSEGDVVATIYSTTGGVLDAESTRNVKPVGRLTLRSPDSCSLLELSWQFDQGLDAGAFAGRTGEQTVERIGHCQRP